MKEATYRKVKKRIPDPEFTSSTGGQELPEGMWLVDTGSGHDLITPDVADDYQELPVDRVTFHTAGGRVLTNRALTIKSTILQGEAQPYVLPSTPWVLSVGRRVMEMGYSFVWLANSNPYLLSPSGARIDLQVHGHIPYLQVGHPSMRAMAAILALPRPVYPSKFKSAAARTAGEDDESEASDDEEQWTLVQGSGKGPKSILKSSPAPTSGAKYFVPSSDTSSDDRRAGNLSEESNEDQASEDQEDV